MRPEQETKMTQRTKERRDPFQSPSSIAKEQRPAETFIPAHGGYQKLLSYQKAQIVYDGTVRFCEAPPAKARPHLRPDDPGRALWQTKHHRRQPGFRHLQGN